MWGRGPPAAKPPDPNPAPAGVRPSNQHSQISRFEQYPRQRKTALGACARLAVLDDTLIARSPESARTGRIPPIGVHGGQDGPVHR